MSAGFILVERELLSHPVLCRNPEFDERSAFLWLIAEAAYKPVKKMVAGELVTLKVGQLCHSFRFMAKAWDWDLARVQRFLNRLKSNTMIDTEIFRGRLIVSVCNYSKYQQRFTVDRSAADTAAETKKIQLRYKRKTVKTLESNNVGVTRESGGCRGEEPTHRNGRQWSPKIDDPRQTDLITDTALAADYEPPANPAPAADEPEPELPLMLSAEGEILPPGELVPVPAVTVAPEATAAAPAPTGTNVVPHETVTKKRAARGGGGSRWELGRQVPPDWIAMAYADRERLSLPWANLEAAAADFSDYWPHQPGAGGMKLDWQATWRRWARTQRGGNNGKHHSNKHQTGPNVNGAVFAEIFEQIARRS